jgi:cytochrome c oxidase assembly protein subunit 15
LSYLPPTIKIQKLFMPQESSLPESHTTTTKPNHKTIAIWLLVCCTTIFGMIILGGVTRLTGSGLSMVEWAPIMGILPPLNQAEWQDTFLLYQQFPEYQLKNFDMSLTEFKSIFWFEYGHRLLGRSIGMIFLLPFLFFLFRGKIEKALTPKLVTMFVLGGLQGLMGWYMVKSGLVNDPHVSQYRLTAHLGLAVVIYAYMFWVALGLLYPKINDASISVNHKNTNHRLGSLSLIITGIIFITILSGGFVAGTRAGFAFNTFPLMDGQLIPNGLFAHSPWWRNFFENIVTVQFNHRVLATLLFLIIPVFWFKMGKLAGTLKSQPLLRAASHLLLAALALQITLGISTLLLVVPVALAAAHQAGAIILLTAALFTSQQLQR